MTVHHRGDSTPSRRRLATALALLVAVLAAATVVGIAALWPDDTKVATTAHPYSSAQGVSVVSAQVTWVSATDCGGDGTGPDGLPAVAGTCGTVRFKVDRGPTATTIVQPATYLAGIQKGDRIKVVRLDPPGTDDVSYQFLDFERSLQLSWLAVAFAVLAVVVARWRGLLALAGVVGTVVALTQFMLPALLAGEDPLAVAVVGSSAIVLVVLYLVHGISIRTTAALLGTLVGLAVTAVLGVGATRWAHLTGLGSEDDQTLLAVAGQISLSGVVAASMVVAGLGVLNDVTVTQASAVWELRIARPDLTRSQVVASAMRIGRDHIASSVYTLVFAYAGSAMTVLLLITAYQRSLAEMAGTEEIGSEIARTLVGLIGLVLAVPVTTMIAVVLAPPPPHPSPRR